MVGIVLRVIKWLSQRKEEEVSREELKNLPWGRGRTEAEGQFYSIF